uniref:Major sperm protein n=1 Tax=Wuchereria bancrofti TaxID=6293 RepID=A0AAF5RXS6_WUCBA
MRSSKSNNKISKGDEQQTINLVSLDQTYVCFDVEQLTNARQEVKLKRYEGIQDDIAWRMRTNVPTRYLINPSRGFIQNNEPITLSIELLENKFHPNHKLTLQAIAIIDGCNERTIWKHQNAKNYSKVQLIRLKLSTVLINVETTKYEEENFTMGTRNLEKFMEQSSTTGFKRIKELEKLLNTLEDDFSYIRKSTDRTKRLKAALEQALDSRKLTLVELKRRVIESDQETKKLKKELENKEVELQLAQQIQANKSNSPTCRIS